MSNTAEIYKFPGSEVREPRARSPQLEDGYTRISHELMVALARARLNGSEYPVVLFVIRETYGWNLKHKVIRGDYMSRELGIPSEKCSKAVAELLRRKVLYRVGDSQGPIGLNKHYDQWERKASASKKVNRANPKPSKIDSNGQGLGDQNGQSNKDRKDTPPTHNNSAREFPMSLDWEPGQEFEAVLSTHGVGLKPYLTDDVLLEFKSFWMTRPNHMSQNEWNHKLLSALKSEKQRASIMQGNRVANDGREGVPPCPHESILAAWDEVLGDMKGKAPNILDWKGTKIAVALEERWREFFGDENTKARYSDLQGGIEWFRKAFQHFAASSNFRQSDVGIFDVFYKTRFSKAANGSLPTQGGAVR